LHKQYTLEELDSITQRKQNEWTYTSQIAYALHQLGLDVHYYSKYPIAPLLDGEAYFVKHYGKDAQNIIDHTNIPVIVESVKNLIALDIFEQKIVTIQ